MAWVVGGVLETPGLDLGILDSITRRVMLDMASQLGLEFVEEPGIWASRRRPRGDGPIHGP